MVVTYMQRKVHIRNKSIDEYMKLYGRMLNMIFKVVGYKMSCKKYWLKPVSSLVLVVF